jgi:outer membrane protein TolC
MQPSTNWIRKSIFIIFCYAPALLHAQTLTLEQVCDSARVHYPMTKQKQLVQQTASISIDNLRKSYLPQVNINGQASYQTDVTKISIPVPGIVIEPLSKDQYKLTADISQVLYDGGMVKQQQQLQQLNAAVEDQKLEVELYNLKQRITNIYLSILYIEDEQKQVDLLKEDIRIAIKSVQAQVDNGTSFKSNVSLLKAELLKTEQRNIELRSTRKGLIDVLSLFVQQPLSEQTRFEKPVPQLANSENIVRPELQLYANQGLLTEQQNQLIRSRNLPKASAFVQGGYGRPGLNLLKNSFEPYGIGGLRLNWSLGGLYTVKKEKQQVAINRQVIGLQRETFLLNTQTQFKQQAEEIEKLQRLISSDNEIIDLREDVKKSVTAQLENGVITASDYLKEVNADDQAKQTLITHRLQLLQAQVTLQLITGK